MLTGACERRVEAQWRPCDIINGSLTCNFEFEYWIRDPYKSRGS